MLPLLRNVEFAKMSSFYCRCNCATAPPPPLQPAEETLIKPTALKPARSCHSLKFMHSTEFYYKIYILQICRNCSKLHSAFYGSSQNL